ncbi:MAG TPA: hypothetical protein PLH98_17600, partial [Ruminococcus flavefaciens]|nr:hypothetical protein [Ruminococcus flavefaciens]
QTPFLKLSVLILPPYRAHLIEMINSNLSGVRPIWGQNSIKSLWKRGSGEEPFLRKVFPR